MSFRPIFLASILAVLASAALADGVVQKLITPADQERLDQYEETRKAALAEARTDGDPADLKQLEALLARPLVAFSDKDLTGKWRCRTIKVGGDFGVLDLYDWFTCKVTDDGSGWVLHKTSGSQRTEGRLYDDGNKRASTSDPISSKATRWSLTAAGRKPTRSAMPSAPAATRGASSSRRLTGNRGSTFSS